VPRKKVTPNMTETATTEAAEAPAVDPIEAAKAEAASILAQATAEAAALHSAAREELAAATAKVAEYQALPDVTPDPAPAGAWIVDEPIPSKGGGKEVPSSFPGIKRIDY